VPVARVRVDQLSTAATPAERKAQQVEADVLHRPSRTIRIWSSRVAPAQEIAQRLALALEQAQLPLALGALFVALH